MNQLLRCRSCRTMTKDTNQQKANDTATCCDNPYYVKILPVHFMHKEAKGQVYANSVKVGGFMEKLLEAEGTPNKPLRLACKQPTKQQGVAAVSMAEAVTCPDCLEWMSSNNLQKVDISVPPDMPSISGVS